MEISLDEKVAEIDRNFARLQELIPNVMKEHQGQYALMRAGEIVSYHNAPVEAEIAGDEAFDDKVFSIQRISDEPGTLGWYSYVDAKV